jgi:hypothetical protein
VARIPIPAAKRARTRERLSLIAAASYLLLGLIWIYGFENTRAWTLVANTPFFVVVVIAHACLGVAVGRWWCLLLPPCIVLLALPAGYNLSSTSEIPVWASVALTMLYAGPALAVGITVRLGADTLRERRRRRAKAAVRQAAQ